MLFHYLFSAHILLAGRACSFPHEEAQPGRCWWWWQQLVGLAAGGGAGVLGKERARAGSGAAQTDDP